MTAVTHKQRVLLAIKAEKQILYVRARTGLIDQDSEVQDVFFNLHVIPIEHHNCLILSPHGASQTVKDLWLFPPHSLSICGSIFIWP